MANFLDIDYEIRSIADDIDYPEERKSERSLIVLDMAEKSFSEFRDVLKESGCHDEEIDSYMRAIEVLRNYFKSKGAAVKLRDAYIHYFYLIEKREEFKKVYGESGKE